MTAKLSEKEKAISLRKEGLSYSEILKQIQVAKSTLSLWLRSVGLSKKQKQRLTEKKLAAVLRGALKKKEIRILKSNKIKQEAKQEIGNLSKREIWLFGVALYWAEGTKEKEWRPGSGVKFSNSDPYMISFFIKWLLNICKIPKSNIGFEIYTHKSSKHRIKDIIDYWSEWTKFPKENFKYIYFKKNKIKTKRKNIGDNYYGLLRVKVSASSELCRKIAGWTEGMIGYMN